ISNLFSLMIAKEASDIYLRTKAYPRARIHGKIETISEEELTREDMDKITNLLLSTDTRKKKFKEDLDIDFIHEEPGLGRFRINVFTQRGTPAVVARHVHTKIRTFDELG